MATLQKPTPLLTPAKLDEIIFESPYTLFSQLKTMTDGRPGGMNTCELIYSLVLLSTLDEALTLLRGTSGTNKSNSDIINENSSSYNQLCSLTTCSLAKAAYQGNTKACKLLICAGGNLHTLVGYRGTSGTALLHAVSRRCHDTAQLLLDAGSDPNLYVQEKNYPLTPLYQVVLLDDIQMAKLLIAAGALLGNDFDDRDFFTPLEIAALNGNTELVSLIIHHLKRSINQQNGYGVTMLSRIVSHHNLPLVRLLLEAGARPNISDDNGNTALHFANFDEAVLLLRYRALATENKKGETPLHLTDDPSVVELLLERDPGLLNRLTAKGETALYRAAKLNRVEVVTKLLEHQARCTATIRGKTPLYIAMKKKCEEVVILFLTSAHLKAADLFPNPDETLLDQATSLGNSEIVRLLLEKGALPSVSALHLALKRRTLALFNLCQPKNYSQIITLLVKALFPDEAS